jgi:hypothetical protein
LQIKVIIKDILEMVNGQEMGNLLINVENNISYTSIELIVKK